MKICIICNEYPPGPHGGIGTFTQLLARGLTEAGHEVRVTGVYTQNYPGPEHSFDGNVEVWRYRFPLSRGRWVIARYRLYREIRNWAASGLVDLVEAPDYGAPVAFWPRFGVPVVVRLHSGNVVQRLADRSATRLERLLYTTALRRADYICADSRYIATCVERIYNRAMRIDDVLYPFIAYSPAPTGHRHRRSRSYVIFAGTLCRNKGVVSLVDAWKKVIGHLPDAELHMFGKDGYEQGTSMRRILEDRLGAAGRSVVFHGHVSRDELREWLSRAAVAVFPSFTEGFALVPLEAMSVGCPVIYTRRASGPELIADGQNGLLVDPGSPAEIAGAIIKVLKDPGLAEKLGRKGQETVIRKFSQPVAIAANEKFYRKCIDGFSRHSGSP